MSVPREIRLRTVQGRIQVVQQPYAGLDDLRGARYELDGRTIPAGSTALTGHGAGGKALDIVADIDGRSATTFGLKVRTGNGEETVIGYDRAAGELYVDRTRSGAVGFSADFPGVQRAPVALKGGRLKLRVLVDWSSVEVFTDDGQRVITDQIFPAESSQGVAVFATGGSVRVRALSIYRMRSIW